MTILYISNFFNHHQKPLSDSLYRILGEGNYFFVETHCIQEEQIKLGYAQYCEPYILRYNKQSSQYINKLILDFDVVICGEAPVSLVKKRYNLNRLTFRDDESRYKTIFKYLKWPIYSYQSLFYNKGYLLCASAYGPIDYLLSGMNPKRVYKWGYFPEINSYNLEDVFNRKECFRRINHLDISIVWVGRLIDWKHPESIVVLAKSLKEHGYSFRIRVIGTGPKDELLRDLINKHNLSDVINMLGAVPSYSVREYMLESDVAIVTSDRQEGWGAVINEAMNSACAIVASQNIGSVPYLLNENGSGLTFYDCDWKTMSMHVMNLIDRPKYRYELAINAYSIVNVTWNADVASKNLLSLIDSIRTGRSNPNNSGPCSRAPIIFRKTKCGHITL